MVYGADDQTYPLIVSDYRRPRTLATPELRLNYNIFLTCIDFSLIFFGFFATEMRNTTEE